MTDTDRPPTDDELARVRRYECRMGHSWDIHASIGEGPMAVLCGHCGEDSGLARFQPETAAELAAALCALQDIEGYCRDPHQPALAAAVMSVLEALAANRTEYGIIGPVPRLP